MTNLLETFLNNIGNIPKLPEIFLYDLITIKDSFYELTFGSIKKAVILLYLWYSFLNIFGNNITSTFHALVTVLLSLYNIYFFNDEFFLKYFMSTYFLMDLFYLIPKKKYDMIFHHVAILYFFLIMDLEFKYDNDLIKNIVSKVSLVETSTIFLNEYKRTKKHIHGFFLILTFFLIRIIGLTYIFNIISKKDDLHEGFEIFSMVFVFLNYYWFHKIVKIAYSKIKK